MKSIIYIFLTLVFFVYIICNSILYMVVNDNIEKRFNKKVNKLSKTFKREILNHLNKLKNNESLTYRKVKYMRRKLNNKAYERVFNDTITAVNEDNQNHIYVKAYMKLFDKYIKKSIKKNSKVGSVKNIYVVYLLGQYKVDNEYINEFCLKMLKTNSLYLKYNAINTISQIGNVNYFIKSLLYMSKSGGHLNKKILIDIVDRFGGNIEELENQLIDHFDEFSLDIQRIIIDHFTNRNIEFVASDLSIILSNINTDKEIKASIIKYFNVINYPPVKQTLINILDSEQWELRALSAKALSKYYSQDTFDKLLHTITDSNWHVRLNSAMSLLEFNLGDSLIYEVLKKDDKYSRDILFHAMFVKNKIAYTKSTDGANEQVAVTLC